MKHLCALHGCKKYAVFHCPVASCKQIFTCSPSYEKHLKKHFKNSEDCVKEIKQKHIQQNNGYEKPKMQSESYEPNICHEKKVK